MEVRGDASNQNKARDRGPGFRPPPRRRRAKRACRERGNGGAEGNRTPDLCSAIAALSHLSYGPARAIPKGPMDKKSRARRVVSGFDMGCAAHCQA